MRIFRKISGFYRNEKGTTAIEFAMLSTVFFMIVFGIIEAGRLALVWNGMQYSIENATRYILVNDGVGNDEVVAYIEGELDPLLIDDGNIDVVISYVTRSGVDFVEVDGTYVFETMVPLLPASWTSFTLTASSSMPIP